MSYITENTKWMSDRIGDSTKDLVARFYELADSKSPDAGQLMATDVFSEDAVLASPNGTFNGFEGTSPFHHPLLNC